MTDESTERRNAREGERYRVLQAYALMKLFWEGNGRHPDSNEELFEWAYDNPSVEQPIDPAIVLTDDEIVAVFHREGW